MTNNTETQPTVRTADLMRYADAVYLRPATKAELDASVEQARWDGGAGVITVDGVSCYVCDY